MYYLGGKRNVAKSIAAYLELVRMEGQVFVEPFVGGAWVTVQMSGTRRCSDSNKYLIALYRALQAGWLPPESVSLVEYESARAGRVPDHLRAFIGFGCSFGAKWFGGYARDNHGRNYARGAARSLLRKLPALREVEFSFRDYRVVNVRGSLVYCDPPYAGTTRQYGVDEFDTSEFWNIMREWSKSATVLISEYEAPKDFDCVLEISTHTGLRGSGLQTMARVERLFRWCGS